MVKQNDGEPKAKEANKELVKKAVALGKEAIKAGKSKADAARAIFGDLKNEDKAIVIQAFVDGAGLTPKGATTYWYNCRRKAAKQAQ